ncbi:unnamed protein product [Ilex paraguariensis]|uniref:Uncharacterized protein n=1 Tax=Ilex paraguariensis TaxID=185542 RepID=A0ABC8RM63_9AQUA
MFGGIVVQALHISCGGWRRPHSYYLGDVPEIKNCFAFVKDDIIYVHRHWVPEIERTIYPQNLHLQFHGREMHSLCFISECSRFSSNEKQCPFSRSGWIATGCEDGTVRLTRYGPGVEKWSASKLLGEHVGGSAVRSICTVSKIHVIAPDLESMPNGTYRRSMTSEDQENPFLLISVGAKRVITAWKRKFDMTSKKKEDLFAGPDTGTEKGVHFSEEFSLMSFQWISTNMPTRNCSIRGKGQNIEKEVETAENICSKNADATSESHFSEDREMDSKPCLVDKYEDDWRHLAVTAFLVKVFGSRISVCFVVVACSDATVALRALILPYRLWFDVALLVPLSSPVLALQHVVIPKHLEKPSKNNDCSSFEDQIQNGSLYLLISGCTDGSIVFWDLTDNVENFMHQVLALQMENYIDCQKRPRTGRGSQGGRWWRSLGSHVLKKKPGEVLVPLKATLEADDNMHIHGSSSNLSRSQKSAPPCSQARPPTSLGSGASADDLSLEISKVWPLHVLYNIHQSGVNCLHVSVMKDSRVSKSGFLYYVMSGGDDQALHCLRFDLALRPSNWYSPNFTSEMQSITALESTKNCMSHCQKQKYGIRFLSHDKVISAHSSAIKGVWTDGSWVFSAGLDQRVRCWHIEQHGKLTEHTHLVISVPEPEALDARACGRNHYQIVVAGRGMQIVEFFGPAGMDGEESGSIC